MMRLTIALVLLAGGPALAQAGPGTGGSAQGPTASETRGTKLSKVDEVFVSDAAHSNLAEIKLGQLATEKGSTHEIRAFGQSLVDDHTKIGDRMKAIATSEGFRLPTQLSPDQQATYDRLSMLSGSAFDHAFLQQMKQTHRDAISLFQDEAQNGRNEQLKRFAQSTLPALHQHQAMITRSTATM
jgi:putative membrane protein